MRGRSGGARSGRRGKGGTCRRRDPGRADRQGHPAKYYFAGCPIPQGQRARGPISGAGLWRKLASPAHDDSPHHRGPHKVLLCGVPRQGRRDAGPRQPAVTEWPRAACAGLGGEALRPRHRTRPRGDQPRGASGRDFQRQPASGLRILLRMNIRIPEVFRIVDTTIDLAVGYGAAVFDQAPHIAGMKL